MRALVPSAYSIIDFYTISSSVPFRVHPLRVAVPEPRFVCVGQAGLGPPARRKPRAGRRAVTWKTLYGYTNRDGIVDKPADADEHDHGHGHGHGH